MNTLPPPLPVLYSFRRCPYAMRARMAIWRAGIAVELFEVALKDKPLAMLQASSKGTVPVLIVGDQVIDESLDIMRWALQQHDPDGWLARYDQAELTTAMALIEENDQDFKGWLDRYKYAQRFTAHPPEYYRQQGAVFLHKLEQLLNEHRFLLSPDITFADIAIFPFVRQFAMVDQSWFEQSPYPALQAWLRTLLALPLFIQVMAKPASPDPGALRA